MDFWRKIAMVKKFMGYISGPYYTERFEADFNL